MFKRRSQDLSSSSQKVFSILRLTMVFLLFFSLSEILLLIKEDVYKPKCKDIFLYFIISLFGVLGSYFFLTRLLLALIFIIQISEAIYYQFYGQFYGPTEVWLLFIETKDIISGIGDSFQSLSIYITIMLVSVMFSLSFSHRRFAEKWQKKWVAIPCLLSIVVIFLVQFYRAINGQMYKFNPDLRHSILYNGLSALSFSTMRLIPKAIFCEDKDLSHYNPYKVSPVDGTQAGRYSIILSIGESLNPHHVSALCYARDTTPELQALLRQYKGTGRLILSNSVSTRVAIPMLLNNLREPDNYAAYKSKTTNIFTNAKKRGYQTAFISAQGLEGLSNWIGIRDIDLWEDTQIRPAPHVGADIVLESSVEKAPLDWSQPFLIVLNSRAPHIPYKSNIPRGFEKFSTPHLKNKIEQKQNEYDDAIRFYDRELTAAIRRIIEKSSLPVLVFITSDHGERVGDDSLFGHSIVDMKIAEVPFFYFSNDPDFSMEAISKKTPLNHYQVATLINNMLGFEITNPNQTGSTYFITGGDIRGLSKRISYELNDIPQLECQR